MKTDVPKQTGPEKMAAEFDTVLGPSFAVGFGATVGDGIDGSDCRQEM